MELIDKKKLLETMHNSFFMTISDKNLALKIVEEAEVVKFKTPGGAYVPAGNYRLRGKP